jgi:hypothetical protein
MVVAKPQDFKLLKNRNLNITTELKWFLAGFIEGEGSLCVSVKRNSTSRFGFYIDPEFYIYQHVSGIAILEVAKRIFNSGSIHKKQGSENVYYFTITNRKSLREKVLPYFSKFVLPFTCKYQDFYDYVSILDGLDNKKHYELSGFLELLEVVYRLNPNSKGKDRDFTFDELKTIILRDYTPNK